MPRVLEHTGIPSSTRCVRLGGFSAAFQGDAWVSPLGSAQENGGQSCPTPIPELQCCQGHR